MLCVNPQDHPGANRAGGAPGVGLTSSVVAKRAFIQLAECLIRNAMIGKVATALLPTLNCCTRQIRKRLEPTTHRLTAE
jgi:hypothetical protein